jgi:hypothetical protein
VGLAKSGKLPNDIPASPSQTYKNNGWLGMGDWLGTGRIANSRKKHRSFEEARKFVRSLRFNSGKEWHIYAKSDQRPSDIPTNPHRTYRDSGWSGMGNWLGSWTVSNALREFRPFQEARNFTRTLNLRTWNDWVSFVKSGRLPNDIPSNPDKTYRETGWAGMKDWLESDAEHVD